MSGGAAGGGPDEVREQRVVLVGLHLHGEEQEFEEPLAELARLAHTAGGTVVARMLQRRHKPDSKTFIGRGKVEELGELVRQVDAHLVLFDNDLSPAQERNLEKALECGVIDRSRLILDIFALRARTREARLQVELAQLEYTRSRLKRMWTHLERMEGAIGTRGPGEKQIEEDRRLIDRRIQQLRRALDLEERRRETRSASRAEFFTISLLGYTNAGKSTLLRELTSSRAFVEDKLFATLDTQTRAWDLPGNQRVFLSDTVGFIRDLPHHLVASFRSTLAEAAEADLILHVVDASSADAEAHIRVVDAVLDDLGAVTSRLLVLNKIDAVRDALQIAPLVQAHPRALQVSAVARTGLDALAERVSEIVQSSFVSIETTVPAGAGRLLAMFADRTNILERRYEGDQVVLRARASRRDAARIYDEMRRLGLAAPTQDADADD